MQDLIALCNTEVEILNARTLAAGESLYALLEHATDMIVRVGSNGSVLYANKAVRDALGFTSEELVGRQARSMVAPEFRGAYTAAVRRLVRTGELPDFSAELLTRSGGRIVVRGSANCDFENRQLVSVRLIFRDVTVKQRLREELGLIENVASLVSEAEDLTTGFSDALERICEYGSWDRGEVWLRGRSGHLPEFLTSWTRLGIQEALLPAAASDGQREGEALLELAVRGRHAKGMGRPGSEDPQDSSSGTLAVIPLMAGDELPGLLAFYSTTKRPVTEQRLEVLTAVAAQIGPLLRRLIAEEGLRASEVRYRHLIETAQEGVWTVDADGRTNYVNARMAGMLGYSLDQMAGRSLLEFVDRETRSVMAGHLDRCRGGMKESREYPLLKQDGTECWALVSTSPLVDAGGNLEGALALVTDISERKEAETQLRIREKQLAEAQQVARMGSWDWDLATGALTGSEELYRVLDLPHDKPLTYDLFLRHVAPADVERVKTAMLDSLARQTPLSIEYSVAASDGSTRTIFSRGDFYADRTGVAVRMSGIAQDITERKTAENELRRTAKIVELANDAVIIRGLDGIITYWNQGAVQLYGWSRDEAIGRRADTLLRTSSPETDETPRAQLARLGKWHGELVQVHKDGRELRVDARWTLLRSSNEPPGVLEINTDVTERRRVQQLFGAVLAAATDYSIIGMDPAGLIHTFNAGAERMLGYSATEMIGKRTVEGLHDRAEIEKRAHELGVEPGFQVFVANVGHDAGETREWTYVRKDGSTLPVSLTVTAMRDATGQTTGYIGIAADITERRAVEQATLALKEAAELTARTKSEFLANMSHEIRTPMNGIAGMTELLLDTDLTQEQREYLELVQVSSDSLLRIIDDILDFSRIDAGKLSLEMHPFELRASLYQTLRTLEDRARKKGVRFYYDVRPGVPDRLVGDLGRLRQVIVNLVENAIKFTAIGEVRIDVATEQESAEEVILRVTVKDTGIGIPEDRQHLMMEPFTQADASTTRRYGGSGLGLSISRQLVEMMGGRLWLESREGEGSTFFFTARLTPDSRGMKKSSNRKVEGQSTARTIGTRKLRVLVAEDNPVNQRLAVALLERHGHSVVVAATGTEAVQLSQSEDFDAILMDVQMPEVGGLEATRIIRRREAETGRHVPIIGVTAHAMRGDADRCIESGMDSFCPKPVRPPDLLAMLDRLVPRAGTASPTAEPAPIAEMQSGQEVALGEDVFQGNGASYTQDERRAKLVEVVGGDEELFAELAEIFLADSPAVLRDLEEAVESSDGQAAARHSHKLRGSAAIFCAQDLIDAALRIEKLGRTGSFAAHGDEFQALKLAYAEFRDLLSAALSEIGRETAAAD